MNDQHQPMTDEAFADAVTECLRINGGCTIACGSRDPLMLWGLLKERGPVMGLLTPTNTLFVNFPTEDPSRFGHNNAINHRVSMTIFAKTSKTHPERILR